MEDQQPDPGDLTTDSAATRLRRRFFRRWPVPPAAAAPEAVEEAPRTPVGKAARSAKTAVTEPEPAAEEDASSVGTADTQDGTDVEDGADVAPETTEAENVELDEPAEEPADSENAVPAEPVKLVPHRPAGKKLLAGAAVASVVFVGASAFAAAMAQPYLSERALVQTKLDIARTATDAISTLWTYTPDDMGSLADRASAYLGGDFAAEYRRYIDAIVEPNKQAQVTNTTEVMGAAVESVSPSSIPTEATALVYTNSVATSPVTKNIPSLRYLSYRLTMQRDGSDWRITRMSTITSFDLTPQV